MGVFRQKSGMHPFFLSESYEIVPKSRFSPSSDAQITKKNFIKKTTYHKRWCATYTLAFNFLYIRLLYYTRKFCAPTHFGR